MNKELVAYALDFTSFLLDRLPERTIRSIRSIILFGSVARGTADKDSDVDLFIDGIKPVPKPLLDKLRGEFPGTDAGKRWARRGITNDIRPIADPLNQWEDLRASILSDGIVLYGKYTAPAKGLPAVIIYWDKIRSDAKRVSLSKALYGQTTPAGRYKGLVERTGSTKLGTNALLADLESSKKLLAAFRQRGITARTIHVARL